MAPDLAGCFLQPEAAARPEVSVRAEPAWERSEPVAVSLPRVGAESEPVSVRSEPVSARRSVLVEGQPVSAAEYREQVVKAEPV